MLLGRTTDAFADLPLLIMMELSGQVQPATVDASYSSATHFRNCALQPSSSALSRSHLPWQVSGRQNKKTVTPEHVEEALKELGFEAFLADVQAYLQQHKEEAQVLFANRKPSEPSTLQSRRLQHADVPHEAQTRLSPPKSDRMSVRVPNAPLQQDSWRLQSYLLTSTWSTAGRAKDQQEDKGGGIRLDRGRPDRNAGEEVAT